MSALARRRFLGATGALLLGGTMAGCGGGGGGSAKDQAVKLTMTAWGGDIDRKTYKQRLDMATKKYPHITSTVQLTPGDYLQKLTTAIAGSAGPDLLEIADHVPAFASKNQILPLDDYIEKSGLDLTEMFGDRTPKIFQYEGKQYGLPDRSGAMVVYYNKKMFDAAEVDYPSADWSWDDLLDAAKKLTIREAGEVKQWGFATITWWPYWMTFMYQNGGRVLDDDNRPVINSPENVEAMEWYNDLAWKHKVSPTLRDFANYGEGVGPDQLFAQGKLAMEITGFWNIAAANSVEGLDWDIAPLWHGKEAATSAFFTGLAISATTDHPDEVWKVIEYMVSEEGQRPIIDNAEDAPANIKVQESAAFLEPSWADREVNMGAFAESSDFIFVPPITVHWNELLKVCGDNIQLMMNNEVSPKKALDTIQKELERIMGAN